MSVIQWDAMTFGQWLEREMYQAGISVDEMAEICECSEKTVQKFIDDECTPYPNVLEKIQNLFPGGYGRPHDVCPYCGADLEFIGVDLGWVCTECDRRVS